MKSENRGFTKSYIKYEEDIKSVDFERIFKEFERASTMDMSRARRGSFIYLPKVPDGMNHEIGSQIPGLSSEDIEKLKQFTEESSSIENMVEPNPPSEWILSLTDCLFSRKTSERVFEAIVAEQTARYFDAFDNERYLEASFIKLSSSYSYVFYLVIQMIHQMREKVLLKIR